MIKKIIRLSSLTKSDESYKLHIQVSCTSYLQASDFDVSRKINNENIDDRKKNHFAKHQYKIIKKNVTGSELKTTVPIVNIAQLQQEFLESKFVCQIGGITCF